MVTTKEVEVQHRSLGEAPEGAHVEELLTSAGAPLTVLHHRHPPAALQATQFEGDRDESLLPNTPHVPRHLRTWEFDDGGDVVTDRRTVLANADVSFGWVAATMPSPLYRNTTGDELLVVQRGAGRLESVFGVLDVAAGDVVLVPRQTVHRWVPRPGEAFACLIVEARGALTGSDGVVERWPEQLMLVDDDGDGVGQLVKHPGGRTKEVVAHHPFDVVAWSGTCYPWAFAAAELPPAPSFLTGRGLTVRTLWPSADGVSRACSDLDHDVVVLHGAEGPHRVRAGSLTLHPAGWPRTDGAAHGPGLAFEVSSPLLLSSVARAIDERTFPYVAQRTSSSF